jgi:hypothetical protein
MSIMHDGLIDCCWASEPLAFPNQQGKANLQQDFIIRGNLTDMTVDASGSALLGLSAIKMTPSAGKIISHQCVSASVDYFTAKNSRIELFQLVKFECT